MTQEMLDLPVGISLVVAQAGFISLYVLSFTVFAFYANLNGERSWTRIGLILAAVTAAGGAVYENMMIAYSPEQFWHAVRVLVSSGIPFFAAIIPLIGYAYIYLALICVYAMIRITVKFVRARRLA